MITKRMSDWNGKMHTVTVEESRSINGYDEDVLMIRTTIDGKLHDLMHPTGYGYDEVFGRYGNIISRGDIRRALRTAQAFLDGHIGSRRWWERFGLVVA